MTDPVPTSLTTAVVALATDIGDTRAKPLSQMVWAGLDARLRALDMRPDALQGMSLDELARLELAADLPASVRDPATTAGELPERVRGLMSGTGAVAFKLAEFANHGIWATSSFDESFPDRLRTRLGRYCPPVLFGTGDLAIVDLPTVGVVGSRDADPSGLEVAGRIGVEAAERSVIVVSGGARGVDSAAMNGSAESGGGVIGILGDSLGKATLRHSTRHLVREGRALLLSPYPPATRFAAWRVKARDKLIYALSDVTVVVHAAEGSGGTWDGATEALRHGFGRVLVWSGSGEGPGNEGLIAHPAMRISNVAEVFEVGSQKPEVLPSEASTAKPVQETLDLG